MLTKLFWGFLTIWTYLPLLRVHTLLIPISQTLPTPFHYSSRSDASFIFQHQPLLLPLRPTRRIKTFNGNAPSRHNFSTSYEIESNFLARWCSISCAANIFSSHHARIVPTGCLVRFPTIIGTFWTK